MENSARSFRSFGIAWLVLSLLAAFWAFATPIGAAPDEPAHLIKAASVVRGQLVGEHGANGQVVQVPNYIAFTHAQTCYAFDGSITADCVPEVTGDPTKIVDSSTTAGLYNPLYYAIVGWPSLIAPDGSGIYAMRIVSGVVSSAFLAAGFWLIAGWHRRVIPILGYLTAVTPMVLFLNGTVNPNALEICATLAAFVGVLTVVREPDDGRRVVPIIVLVSAAIASNMRGLSLLWLAIALLSPFLLIGLQRIRDLLRVRWVLIALIGTAAAAIAALVWVIGSNSLGSAITGPEPVTNAPGVGTSPILGFAWTISSTFLYAQELVGLFGWLDTPAPAYVYFTWSALVGGMLLGAFVLLRGRVLALVLGLTALVIVLPAVVQGIYIEDGGVVWQGRYILPLFVCLVIAAAAGLGDVIELSGSSTTRLLWIVLGAWVLAQWLAFVWTLKRYAAGLDSGWLEILSPSWQPPGTTVGLTLGFALLLGVGSTTLILALREPREP